MLDYLKLFDAYRVDDWFLFEPYTRELGMWDILAVKSNEKTYNAISKKGWITWVQEGKAGVGPRFAGV
jgi:hypothetical protein